MENIVELEYMKSINEKQNWLTPMFLTVKETAVVINASEKTIRRLIERGIFQCSKAIRKKLIPRKQVETFFERTS
jgi:excisionase family DNA binding protein